MAKDDFHPEREDDGTPPPQKTSFLKRIFARKLPPGEQPPEGTRPGLFQLKRRHFSYLRYKNRRTQEPASILRQFCVNLNEAAMIGRLSPVISRENELQQVARILSRRSKNNPLLIGEAGVGKTAIIEGLAQKIVNRELHAWFNDKIIMRLDLPLLVAGTKYRGEFEGRLKKVLEAVAMQPNIILFIDEVHTLVGAGSSEGSLDAANILKPALARGELRCISATTSQEYQRYIAKDKALARRFQPIRIEQPSPEQVLEIALGVKRQYERFHNVRIPRKTIEAAIKLADRHIPERSMPDKVIDLLDEAAAQARFSGEKSNGAARVISRRMVQEVIASWKRIPVEALNRSEKNLLRRLEQVLSREIVGQQEAIAALARAIRRRRAGIDGHSGPVGVFLFLGQTGVGKTALAQVLAKTLFGSSSALVRLDMTEFSEAHSIAKIIGSPPGYVGFQDGGHLTETIRHRPYSVILLDEIEKAHPSIFNILLQLFDEGRLTDSHGNTVDFSNTIVIMTSNLISAESAARSPLGFLPEKNGRNGEAIDARELLHPFFRAEFSNRIDEVLLFKALGREDLAEIINRKLKKLNEQLAERNLVISLTPACKKFFVERALQASRQGARAVQRLIRQYIEDPLAEAIFNNATRKGSVFKFSLKEGEPTMQIERQEA